MKKNRLMINDGLGRSKPTKPSILSWWPFIFIPLAMIYVYVMSYFGFAWLCAKSFHEPLALPIIGMSILSFFWLAYKTKNELAIAMTFLNIAFFCREWHFAGTDKGIYIAISFFAGWFVYRRTQIEKMITGKRIKIWLFATASCYLFSQIIARRVFSVNHLGMLPLEGEYFISFEETLEGTAHLMMLFTSIIAWSTFYFDRKNTDLIRPKYEAKRALNYIKAIAVSNKKHYKTTLQALILFLIIGGFVWHHKTRPYHFKVVEAGILYRSGWMKPSDMDKITKKYGIRTVVNLCTPTESTYLQNYKDEQRVCQKNNVTVVNIPMPGNTPPTEEQITQWLSLLEDKESLPVLVHCAQGATRTAAMIAVYQMEFLEKGNHETLEELQTFGHRLSDSKRRKIRDFIINYENQT